MRFIAYLASTVICFATIYISYIVVEYCAETFLPLWKVRFPIFYEELFLVAAYGSFLFFTVLAGAVIDLTNSPRALCPALFGCIVAAAIYWLFVLAASMGFALMSVHMWIATICLFFGVVTGIELGKWIRVHPLFNRDNTTYRAAS